MSVPAISTIMVLVPLLLLSNLPWLSNKFFGVIALPKQKVFWGQLLQWAISLILLLLFFNFLEWYFYGAIHPQGWEFYVTFLCLYITASAPSLFFRMYRKSYSSKHKS